MAWSPNYRDEYVRRLTLRNKALIMEAAERAVLMHYYSKNCISWINDWAITFDPRKKPSLMPFKMFPRQEQFVTYVLGCFNDKENGLTEKSRDMGATWLCCAISIWLWLFHPGTVIGWGSNKSENIDKQGNPKAIFPKMRQLLQYLPPWMLPAGFRMTVHATYMQIVNPANGSSIIGEGGDSMGRGGRTSIYFKDESAHYEHPEKIEAALGDNTDVQIDMSSVNGSANVFYRRRMAGEVWYADKPSTPGKVRVFIFDWQEDLRKTPEWHAARRKKAEEEGLLHVFEQEIERNYAGSVARVIIKQEWVRSAVDAHIKLGFNDSGMRIAAQDIADGGNDKNALVIVYGVVVRFADHWGGEAPDAAGVAVPTIIAHKVNELFYDSVGVGAGFKGEINTMRRNKLLPPKLKVYPWNGGSEVLEPDMNSIPGDKDSPLNKDQYTNLKAQSWFRLAARFIKTHKAVTTGAKYDPSELISLDSTMPRLLELMMELSQPTHKPGAAGKILVDKKPDGSSSPNMADGVDMAFNPVRPPKGFFDLD